jgi:hypothetical protein
MSNPIFPEINFTTFSYNGTEGCAGPLASYSATQSSCSRLQTISSCCNDLSARLGIEFDRCVNNSIYGCKAATRLTPAESQVVTGFLWFLIVIGGITMVVFILTVLYKCLKCCFCRNREYSELA